MEYPYILALLYYNGELAWANKKEIKLDETQEDDKLEAVLSNLLNTEKEQLIAIHLTDEDGAQSWWFAGQDF